MGLLTPDPSLNYGFIASIYAVLSAIALLLFAVQHAGIAPSLNGFWMVPAPCLPMLLWVLFMRARLGATPEKKEQ
jgi:hypothetical protein